LYYIIENVCDRSFNMNNHPLENLIEHYLFEKDITIGTREVYQTILKQYLNYLKENKILYAKTNDVMNFLDGSRNKGCSLRWTYH